MRTGARRTVNLDWVLDIAYCCNQSYENIIFSVDGILWCRTRTAFFHSWTSTPISYKFPTRPMWNHQWIVTVSFRIPPPPPKKKCLLTKYSALRLIIISVITIMHWLFSTRPRRSKAPMILLFCCIWSFTIFITFLFALTTRNYLQIKVGMNGIKSSESSIWEPASFSKLRRKDIWESKWGFSASFILLTHST